MKTRSLMLLGMTLLALAACGTARRGEPIAGPLASTDPQVRAGHVLFDRHCGKCHVGGDAGLAPAINNKPLPAFLIRTQIRVGMGAMPSFKEDEISDSEVDAIIAYLKALRHRGGH
jgi:mono/diheme cytochrome c family protein